MVSAALLVVDVQYDFLPGGSLAVNDGDQILPVVHDLLKGKWDFVVASQDYHPPGHVSFASTHKQELFSQIDVPYPFAKEGEAGVVSQVMWPDHCIQGTHGAEIQESVMGGLKRWLDSGKGLIVQKGTNIAVDAYSAFTATAETSPSASYLMNELHSRGITSVFIVGLATDYCVKASALDAKKAGLDTYIIREGVRAVAGDEGTENVQNECDGLGVSFIGRSDDIMKPWL